MMRLAELYNATLCGVARADHPPHGPRRVRVRPRRLCLHRKRITISTVLAGQRPGVREADDSIRRVGFMHDDLGYFDLEQKTLQPFDNPFSTRLSPMSQVRSVTYVSGLDRVISGSGRGTRTPDPRIMIPVL